MRRILLVVALTLFAPAAYAQGSTCKSSATEKKLAGAALKSFMIKCERDAKSACDADTKAQKLAGATKNSHMKKCVSEVANFQRWVQQLNKAPGLPGAVLSFNFGRLRG